MSDIYVGRAGVLRSVLERGCVASAGALPVPTLPKSVRNNNTVPQAKITKQNHCDVPVPAPELRADAAP